MLKLSIVILAFNSAKFIKPCLDSVFGQDNLSFEVILVDNGSEDDTLRLVKEGYPSVRLIKNKKNEGAAKARNQGIEIASGEWILSLDCDVILEKNFINKITGFMKQSDAATGMFQPKILKDDKKTIYSCGIRLSKFRKFYDIGKNRPDNGRFNKSGYVFGVCSAAAFYKRQMLEDVKEKTGYFDERFFFLVEDADLAWRAQKKGWKAGFCPEAVCYHTGNSSGSGGKIRQYLCFRNRYFLILKNDDINILRGIVIALLYDLPRLGYLMLTNNYTRKALGEIKAFVMDKKGREK